VQLVSPRQYRHGNREVIALFVEKDVRVKSEKGGDSPALDVVIPVEGF
jgi:hypothetical protein